jgi:hypothetical protein
MEGWVDDVTDIGELGHELVRPDYFHIGNLGRIKDAQPNASATVHRDDLPTISELMRRGFHLVDMSGEIWTMRRAG